VRTVKAVRTVANENTALPRSRALSLNACRAQLTKGNKCRCRRRAWPLQRPGRVRTRRGSGVSGGRRPAPAWDVGVEATVRERNGERLGEALAL
jgi:hypothetical protein